MAACMNTSGNMKYLFVAIAYLVAANPTAAENAFGTSDRGVGEAFSVAQEIDRLVILLKDDVLRDLVCRVAFETYTPRTLGTALNTSAEEVTRRIETLRGWGLVRYATQDSGIRTIEPVPGSGEATLRRWAAKYCPQDAKCGMYDHFSEVASDYNEIRTTDTDPIQFIKNTLRGWEAPQAVEIGCGPGRYALQLLKYLPGLNLVCGDVNESMLEEAERYLRKNGQTNFSTARIDAMNLKFPAGSLDCVFTFNAIHHFDPVPFLHEAVNALREDGRVFIYTRFKSQNARSIWGKYFSGFTKKEKRLTEPHEAQAWANCVDGVYLEGMRQFKFKRVSSVGDLVHQAKKHHYSTFSLYTSAEFAAALAEFEARIRRDFPDPEHVEWEDENVMLVFRRTQYKEKATVEQEAEKVRKEYETHYANQ